MTNEMKLLRAFIEASGYEVEEIEEQQIPSGQIIVAHDYKATKKQAESNDDLEAIAHLMSQFRKGVHETMKLEYKGKSYELNEKGELSIV